MDRLEAALEEQALAEHEKAFNHSILYGKDADHLAIIDAARRFPMMAERQLVVVREAQDLKSINELASYAEKPAPTTILVLCHKHKTLNGNTKLAKIMKAKGGVFEAKALYDNQVPDWIRGYLKPRNYDIDPAAAELLAQYLGTSLSKIANELDKLLLNLTLGTTISTAVVEDQVGISKDYNTFELQRALGRADAVLAQRIVRYFAANPKAGPTVVVLASLYNYFSKLLMLAELRQVRASESEILTTLKLRSNFFLKEFNEGLRVFTPTHLVHIMALLREYDLKSKGYGALSAAKEDGALLQELVFKILGSRNP
ncbi:MAG: DNA polymerase III subunit delta [Lewinella sp.]|nr:DNA polymerase III subunit delta [Lewinella sp.]